ncbi:MAG: hypothetical protein ACI8PZ_003501 [Myxococcota bacterium]|jgi:hypothetical protein
MSGWRDGLLVAVITGSVGGWAWMIGSARPALQSSLGMLTLAFTLGVVGVLWHYRAKLTPNLLTSNLALGALVHLMAAAAMVGADRLWSLGLVPALASNGHHFLIAILGIGGAFLTWTRARGSTGPAPSAVTAEPEPAPAEPSLDVSPDWDGMHRSLAEPALQRQLQALRRIAAALDEGPAAARRVVHQEANRLATSAEAAEADDDLLSRAAAFLEWGAQKIPELGELDAADLLMGKVIAEIRAQHSEVVHRFVDHRQLEAIHPIDRDTANLKCDERAASARAALPLLRSNGMRMSEDLVAAEDALAAFRSVTGFQVVDLGGDRYVTFEGNGRREALRRGLGDDEPVFVEVREYRFSDPGVRATMRRRVERVQRWKGVVEVPQR